MRKEHTVIAFLSTLLSIAVLVIVGLVFSQRTAKPRASEADEATAEHARPEPGDRRPTVRDDRRLQGVPDRWSSETRPSLHADIPAVYRTLKSTTNLAAAGLKDLGVESQANAAEPYLIGMIQAIRAIDPNILTGLKDVYADEMCAKTGPTQAQMVTYAKVVMFESRLGSGRGIECALKRSSQEDVVMWSLLDAWNSAGREQLPALATISTSAKDERTLRRLYPEKYQAERVAAAATSASTQESAAETAHSRASNPNR